MASSLTPAHGNECNGNGCSVAWRLAVVGRTFVGRGVQVSVRSVGDVRNKVSWWTNLSPQNLVRARLVHHSERPKRKAEPTIVDDCRGRQLQRHYTASRVGMLLVGWNAWLALGCCGKGAGGAPPWTNIGSRGHVIKHNRVDRRRDPPPPVPATGHRYAAPLPIAGPHGIDLQNQDRQISAATPLYFCSSAGWRTLIDSVGLDRVTSPRRRKSSLRRPQACQLARNPGTDAAIQGLPARPRSP